MKQKYVAGFMFRCVDLKTTEVALVMKKKGGEFQVGRLNGIGGKIEGAETPLNAMTREFAEETGSETKASDWREFCVLQGKGWKVHFFVCLTGQGKKLRTMEEEEIKWYPVVDLNRKNIAGDADNVTVPNLRWLIPLALDKDHVFAEVTDESMF